MFLALATLALAALARPASAHIMMYSINVNGKNQDPGRGKYIREGAGPGNDPIRWSEVSSPALICNKDAKPVPSYVKVSAGDKLSFQWYHYKPNDPSDVPYIIDKSHIGAIITYIASDPQGAGTGPIWSKLHHAGKEGGEWATMKLVANKGWVDFALPKSLKKGKYVIRQEILALHQADEANRKLGGGPEFYPSCVQIEVTESSGNATPDQNFDIIKTYSSATVENGKGVWYNAHDPNSGQYNPPGPEVWTGN
jgi:cellulase